MPLTIGKLSQATSVNVETIRYYERIGLLAAPSRTSSGYRTFSEQDAARLRFIKRGRELGFSLDEIRTLVGLADQPGHACTDVDRLVQSHLLEVRQRIADLQRLEAELQRLAGCSESSVRDCRIIEALTAGGHK
ncbi:MerR family DNA-binding protein [Pseudomonas stutzeri]|uniref:MerR family transcriptional regulator n=1 Tax=Stutzerimonas stutzeri KOS6 TaxID=1218352 RepID=A0A061JNU3_STUST|nr:helix-turn-helix domain-containing protein [Stutzerimonas stutzeri]EWC41387.1 MerR family transcriptional regulator [Stutzerimonas stutzeri KOS6]MBK3867105.1 MerR family DNA-binding protein [Stutzerimonas stutzeri]